MNASSPRSRCNRSAVRAGVGKFTRNTIPYAQDRPRAATASRETGLILTD